MNVSVDLYLPLLGTSLTNGTLGVWSIPDDNTPVWNRSDGTQVVLQTDGNPRG